LPRGGHGSFGKFEFCDQNPERILDKLITPSQTVADLGCGMGYFTIPMARLASEDGRVIAVNLQAQMLAGVDRRACRAGLQDRIWLHQCKADSLDLHEQADFVLAFWMVHEVPDKARFLGEAASLLKPGARFLLVEPKLSAGRCFDARSHWPARPG
jgi:ubiquinone/menaquinone biosynthesis C-methylase UbiE